MGDDSTKVPGSTWIFIYKGEPWPVLLCDDELPPEGFMRKRKADWFPAIQLGRRVFIWVLLGQLQAYDSSKKYLLNCPVHGNTTVLALDSPEVQLDKQRRRAFEVDMQTSQTPSWWRDFILHDSDVPQILGKHGPQQALEIGTKRNASKADECRVRDSEQEDTSDQWKSRKMTGKAKLPSHPDVERKDNIIAISSDDDEGSDDGAVEIENEIEGTICKSMQQEASEFENQWSFTSKNEMLQQVGVMIREFRGEGEFDPLLVDRGGLRPHLSGVTPENQGSLNETLLLAWRTAARSGMVDLQLLLYEKLRALYPMSSSQLLNAWETLQQSHKTRSSAETKMRRFLIKHMVKSFWMLVREEGPKLAQLMELDEELEIDVLSRLISEKN